MRILQKLLYLLLIFLGGVDLAHADSDRPVWIDQPPKEDEHHKYYVGRASDVVGEAEAFRQATINGREQAIGANFGVLTQIRLETYQSTDSSQMTQRSEEILRQVRLEDFEQIDFFSEKQQERVNLWLLFKYSKHAIGREKTRLALLRDETNSGFDMLEQGDEGLAAQNGTLEILSRPPGAAVRIDGIERLGDTFLRTPLRLKGLFAAGEHTVEIDDPRHEMVVEKVQLYPGTTARVDTILKRAFGTLTVSTEPPGATFFLGAKLIEPLSSAGGTSFEVKVIAEVPVRLEIRHPEMETFEEEVRLERGERRRRRIVLEAKPATLAVSSSPAGASVEVDGASVSPVTPTGQILVTRGQHMIRVSKNGYHPYEDTVSVRGGEHKVLALVVLKGIEGGLLRGLSYFKGTAITLNGQSPSSYSLPHRGPGTFQDDDEISILPGTYELRLEKTGFHPRVASIDVSEGSVADISNVALVEIFQDPRHLENPPWTISLGAFGTTSIVSAPNVPLVLPAADLRYQFSDWAGVEFAAGYGTTEVRYSNAKLNISSFMIRGGFPISLLRFRTSAIALAPEAVRIASNYRVVLNTAKSSASQAFTQTGYGGSLIYRIFSTPDDTAKTVLGLGFRAGYHHYRASDGFSGINAFSGGAECILGF